MVNIQSVDIIISCQEMDNLTIQVTPVELNHNSAYPLQISCLLKKIAINTGHTLEKHQLTAFPDSSLGKSTFPRGPTLTLSKELQLANTKISLHFMQKRNKTVSCIGSAEVDLASLPVQPVTKISCPLANSVYPQSQLILELKRSERSTAIKSSKLRPYQMSLLGTEGQVKEELFLKRRQDPNIPTAYEISRKNYKQLETSCHQLAQGPKKSPNRRITSRSSKSNSYHQRFTLGNSRTRTTQNVSKQQSPMPRQKTPEPIKISPVSTKNQGKSTVSHYLKHRQSLESGSEQPSTLEIRPYQDSSHFNVKAPGNYSDRIFIENGRQQDIVKREQPINRYLDITQKLQSIQEKLIGVEQKKYKTQASAAQNLQSTFSHQTPHMRQLQQRKPTHRSHDKINISSPTPFSQSQPLNQLAERRQDQIEQSQSIVKATQKKGIMNQPEQIPGDNKSQLSQVRPKLEQTTEPNVRAKELQIRLRKQLLQLQSYNQQLTKQNQLLKASYIDSQATIQKLMKELSQTVEEKTKAEQKAASLQKIVEDKDKRAAEQQQILSKMTQEYQTKVEEIALLQEQINSRPKILKNKQNDSQQSYQKKRVVEAQGNLRLRENQLRHLRLQLQNLRGEKQILQQQIQALAKGNHQQMVRQKSLAKIDQISSSSLVKQTQRQNQSLRAEVKILQEKVEGLNDVLQSLIQTGQKAGKGRQITDTKKGNIQKEYINKLKALEQRCQALEEELRAKKSLMAQMINLIWTQGDSSLMESIEKYMDN